MGLAKRAWMEANENGWSSSDKYVCAHSVTVPALKRLIEVEQSEEYQCYLCGHSPAASLDVVTQEVYDGLQLFYTDIENSFIPYITSEGGYIVRGEDSQSVVYDHADGFVSYDGEHDLLVDEVAESFGWEEWVRGDWLSRDIDDQLDDAWREFSRVLKHERRFVFWLDRDRTEPGGELEPTEVLDAIGRMIAQLDLIQTVAPTELIWRAQPIGSDDPSARRMGTCPAVLSENANRMSPSGIPLFYGASNEETAVAEITAHADKGEEPRPLTVGVFELSRETKVIDFSHLPPVPSIFDPQLRDNYVALSWIHRFVDEISRPLVDEDSPAQIEYVPTQVMTEYFLKVLNGTGSVGSGVKMTESPQVPLVELSLDTFEPPSTSLAPRERWRFSQTIEGILLPSAEGPGFSYVLDIPNDRCVTRANLPQSTEETYLVLKEIRPEARLQ